MKILNEDYLPVDMKNKGFSLLSTEGVIEASARYIDDNFKDVLFSCVFGSYSRNEQKKYSDIDILIVSNNQQPFGRIQKIYFNYPFQFMIIGFENILRFLDSEYRSGNSYILKALSDGIFVKGNKDIFYFLKDRAKNYLKMGPQKINEDQKKYLITNILNGYMKLVKHYDDESKMFGLSIRVFRDIICFLQAEKRQWIHDEGDCYENLHLCQEYKNIKFQLENSVNNGYINFIIEVKSFLEKREYFRWGQL